ncbi:MAG: hypothetical protein R2733_23780 [Acidimicrobiales bacterium]
MPVGIVMAVAMAGGALWLHARAARLDAPLTVALGALIVAGVRSVGSFWLPHLGDGLTRQHLSSLLVTALAAAASAMVAAEGRRTGGGRSADREEGRRRPPPGRRPSF